MGYIITSMYQYLDLITAITTVGLLVTAIFGFYDNHRIVRTQTSMDFCTFIYPMLQSEEYVNREQYLITALSARYGKETPCSFDEIEDPKLRFEIIRYCECLNGIGILLHEHMINDNVIVPYIGTQTTILYELIRPYLNKTREKFADISYECFDEKDNQKVQNAASLYFVHYELLAITMRENGPKITGQFRRKLIRARRRSCIKE